MPCRLTLRRGPAGLKGRDLFELRQLGLQPLEERIREHPPAILRAALHAARVAVADAIQARGSLTGSDRSMTAWIEREDGRGAADAERERQHRGDGEHARHPELTQRVANFADEGFPRWCSLTVVERPRRLRRRQSPIRLARARESL